MDIKEQLKAVRAEIKVLSIKADLTDEEAKKLRELMAQEGKLSSQLEAAEIAAKADAEAVEAAKKGEQEKIDAAVKAAKLEWEKENRRLPMGVAPYQTQFGETWKYDGMAPADLALMIDTLRASGETPQEAAVKALALRITELKDEEGAYVKGAFKTRTGLDPTADAIKAATDPMYTGGSGIGSDWIGTAYSQQLWEQIRSAVKIVSKIPSVVIPDGYSSEYFPIESSDPTWYKIAETTASDATAKIPLPTITASQMATANKQMTVVKMGCRVLYTGEMTEDSLIPFVAQLRAQIVASGAEQMEHAVIDGDTAAGASTNINDIAGTPAGTEVFMLVNGFRKLALVTNTANSRDAGGMTAADFIETVKLMGLGGKFALANRTKVGFLLDLHTYWKALQLPEVKSKDVFVAPTIENGVLTGLWGFALDQSAFMHHANQDATYGLKANTAGKVDLDTAANNITGSILAVLYEHWKLGYKRRMTVETTRIANADSWEIVALTRWGLLNRDNEASAISYNVTV